MKMELDRQLEIFHAHKFLKWRIDVIGAGALGSRVVEGLVKIGLTNIHVWDDDVVMAHNIPNQHFLLSQIGMNKVDAVAKNAEDASGAKITPHKEKVEGPKRFGQIVFVMVDSMATRKKIWEDSLKYKLRVKWVIEGRMGASVGRIYAVEPSKPSHIRGYEATLYRDDEATRSACGATSSIAPTVGLVANVAVWQVIKAFNKETVENETIICAKPLTIVTKMF